VGLLRNHVGNIILKEREYLKDTAAGTKINIDSFKDNLSGLIIVEVDFDSLEASKEFVLPDFLQKGAQEVTEDKQYSNRSLALNGLPG
jgi:CYTH domain-containing protein